MSNDPIVIDAAKCTPTCWVLPAGLGRAIALNAAAIVAEIL